MSLKDNQKSFQKTVNDRLDGCSLYSVTESEFTQNILPNETTDSKHIYFVTTSTGVQLWKGSVRIQFGGGGGRDFTCAVLFISQVN